MLLESLMGFGSTVNVHFEGIVAFEPDKKLEFVETGKAARNSVVSEIQVYFPRLRKLNDFGSKILGGNLRSAHFFWAEVDCRQLLERETDRKVSAYYRSAGSGSERAIFLISAGEKLELKTSMKPQGLVLNQTLPCNHANEKPSPKHLDKVDRESLWWVPRPYELTGNESHGAFSLNDGQAASSLTINEGRLYTSRFSKGEDPWAFETVDAKEEGLANHKVSAAADETKWTERGINRAVANVVALELKTKKLVLKTRRGNIAIRARGSQGGNIWLRNVEAEHLIGEEGMLSGYDPDFAEHYSHSKGAGSFPWVLPRSDSWVGDERRPCAPAFFLPR